MKIFKYIPTFSEKTAVALGFFDGLHIAHQKVISLAVNSGYLPVVFTFSTGINCPESKKDMLLLNDNDTKYNLIKKLGAKVLVEPSFADIKNISAEDFVNEYLVKKLNAKVLICGENFSFGRQALGNAELLEKLSAKNNVQTLIVNSLKDGSEPISSSKIRRALLDADLITASNMLGYDYFWNRVVVEGNKNGRKIGYPTINQNFPLDCIIPKRGVYVSKVNVNEAEYMGVTNIGVRPSVSLVSRPIAETYIINYCGSELYGQCVKVSILKYVRGEKKFDSLQQLKSAIKEDLNFAKNYKYTKN